MINNYQDIPDLRFYPDFLSEKKQQEFIEMIDKSPWCNDLRRRTQHYGYKYDYRNRKIDESMDVGPLPDWAANLAYKIKYCGLMTSMPDQMIVNEYLPGQGIAQHIDCVPCFNDEIVTISLGSVYSMELFQCGTVRKEIIDLELGSALVFCGESRYNWTHGIKAQTKDGDRARGRRLSLTFRKVILS